MLDPFAQLFQHCWGHARSLRMAYKDVWVVSFPRCTAGPNIVGSCCIRLQTTANTHATIPNIVGATMLGVVVSVRTQPNASLAFQLFSRWLVPYISSIVVFNDFFSACRISKVLVLSCLSKNRNVNFTKTFETHLKTTTHGLYASVRC